MYVSRTARSLRFVLDLQHMVVSLTLAFGHVQPPKIVVIGHSMGGVVARAALMMPNRLPHAITALITLGAPLQMRCTLHSAPLFSPHPCHASSLGLKQLLAPHRAAVCGRLTRL
jgi:pimeloyl-ACP methyl ester carboxylesterase